MDMPSHGAAGVLNEEKLRTFPDGICQYTWSRRMLIPHLRTPSSRAASCACGADPAPLWLDR